MNKIILTLLTTVFVGAQAYGVSGTIGFSGTMSQSTTKKGVTTDKFKIGWVTQSGNAGDYSTVPAAIAVTMHNFSFTGNNTLSPLLTGPVTPEWSFTFGGKTYSFDLEVLTSAFSTSGATALTGTGTATIDGQTSNATWALDGTGRKFTFTAAIHTTAVPDGGPTVALLGIALAGIEGGRRLVRARKA